MQTVSWSQYLDQRSELEKTSSYFANEKIQRVWVYVADSLVSFSGNITPPALKRSELKYYDPNGRLVKKDLFGDEGTVFMYIKFEYNTHGQLIKKSDVDLNDKEMSTWTWNYDNSNKLISKIYKSEDGEDAPLTYTYDDSGNLIGHKEAGAEPRIYTYKFDKAKNLTYSEGKTVYLVDDREVWKKVDESSYQYNSKNKMTESKECYGGAGCTNNIYAYDKKGRLVKLTSMGDYHNYINTYHYEGKSMLPNILEKKIGAAYKMEEPDSYEYYIYEKY